VCISAGAGGARAPANPDRLPTGSPAGSPPPHPIWSGWPWLHLAAIEDLFSRRVVGWSMAPHLRTELVIDALEMAIANRSHEPGSSTTRIKACSSPRSRSAGGSARPESCRRSEPSAPGYDNAFAESFSTLKRELVHRRRFRTRDEARAAIFEFIEVFYNRQRRHSTIGMLSPAEFERRSQTALTS
jgi:putative transposase